MNQPKRRKIGPFGHTKAQWVYIFMNSHSDEQNTNIEDKPLFWSAILSMLAIAVYTENDAPIIQAICVLTLLLTGVLFAGFLGLQLWCSDAIVEKEDWSYDGRKYRGIFGKLRYVLTHLGVFIDVLVVLPLPFLLFGRVAEIESFLIFTVALRSTKLLHYNEVMEHSWGAIRRAWPKLQRTLQFTLCAAFIMSTGIYMLERYVQPENLGSVPRAIYFVLVTISTVGYGDISPATAAGKVFTVVFVIGLGLTIFGMVIGAMAESIAEGTQDEVNELEIEMLGLKAQVTSQTELIKRQTEMIEQLLQSQKNQS